jgi:hypothetical protein
VAVHSRTHLADAVHHLETVLGGVGLGARSSFWSCEEARAKRAARVATAGLGTWTRMDLELIRTAVTGRVPWRNHRYAVYLLTPLARAQSVRFILATVRWRCTLATNHHYYGNCSNPVEPERGFEPLTYALRMRCSTN